MLRSYLRLLLFGLGLLLGVQVPGFIESYAQRVDAHRLEAEQALAGFRDTARRFFGGDLEALVAHYQTSDDPVFRSDARSLHALIQRSRLLEREWQALQRPWYGRAWHVLLAADPGLRREALNGYRYQVLLSPAAIGWGLGCGLLLAWLTESLLLLFGLLLPGRRRRGAAG